MKNDFLLGIDYGTKKIGVSIGQIITKSCRPLKIIYKDKFQQNTIMNIIIMIPKVQNIKKMVMIHIHNKVFKN